MWRDYTDATRFIGREVVQAAEPAPASLTAPGS
jgi:hypothetical protein